MQLYVANRIQLLYLPPHTSHVLQPLDISVFGPLKTAYRAALALASPGLSSSLTSKETFLECYFQAREKALTEKNILAGWSGSGLWPINAEKALGSKFVIEDPSTSITVADSIVKPQEASQRAKETEFTTPSNSKQLHSAAISAFKVTYNDPIVRLLFRKIDRGLDNLNWELAKEREEKQVLLKQLEQSNKRKRAPIIRDLNELFYTVQNVQKTRDEIDALFPDDSE